MSVPEPGPNPTRSLQATVGDALVASHTEDAERSRVGRRQASPLRRVRMFAVLLHASAVLVQAAPISECRALAITDPEAGRTCYVELLKDPSLPVLAEAAWALGDVKLANNAFRGAAMAAPEDADVRVRWGELFLATYQVRDAETLFAEALTIDPEDANAKLGLARVALGRFEARAQHLVEDVLAADPDNPQAKLLAARLALEVGHTERARQALRVPLDSDDVLLRLEAMALAAAIDHRLGTIPSPWEDKTLAIHPGYGELFETIAHFYIITRRYREAIAQLERAVEIHPGLWSAHATLGINLLRVNRFDDGRRALTRAHDGYPFNVEVVNTLRLLDSLDGWEVLAEDGLVLRTHPAESGALAPYVRRLVADAVRTVGERYGFVPDYPVVVELYPRHQDFAVRTSGLPGIGVLGVAFGDVVLMDSPSARSVEEGFDWAGALWHEVAHVVTLGATDNLVSRWFSEGVSVFEEWQTGPSRFAGSESAEGASRYRAVPLGVVDAYLEDLLLPVAALDEGFIRPSYPGQIMVSYNQAGLLCEFIANAYGQDALGRILIAYREGKDTVDAVEASVEVSHDALDTAFADYLETRFGSIDPAEFRTSMEEAAGAASKGDWTATARAARRAIASYPNAVESPSAYPLLAQAEEHLGHRSAAIETLTTYWRVGGRSPQTLTRLADWLDDAGDDEASLAVRRSLALVSPLAVENRTRLGNDLLAANKPLEALVEYTAAHSLKPHDAADVHYRLARAYHRLNEVEDARRHVLLALEIAPRFADALSLLLEINQ